MFKVALLAFVAVVIAVASAVPAPLLAADSPTAVPGQYIVIFKSGLAKVARDAHIRRVRGLAGGVKIADEHVFNLHDFGGYSGKLSNDTLAAVRNMPEVAFVEADQTVDVGQEECTTQSGATWGLDRISDRIVDLDGEYTYATQAGEGITAYIIDTGIYTEHNDFGGRAIFGTNTVGDGNNADCNGHGTHVASTTGGTEYGVAKAVDLVAVKVLNCGGSGTWAGVIQGVVWTATDHEAKDNRAVANMSLGGGLTAALNQAVAAAVATGVTFAVAAGNSNADACNFSPASTPEAISVGATDVDQDGTTETDIRSSFSNFGTCTDVFAPGSLVTAAWIGSPTAINTISGTSMASPHVCGVAALVHGSNPNFTPAQIQAHIESTATADIIDLVCNNNAICLQSPNRMLYRSCP